MSDYYAFVGGQEVHGPMTLEDLHALEDAGSIDSETAVREEGSEEWRFWRDVKADSPPEELALFPAQVEIPSPIVSPAAIETPTPAPSPPTPAPPAPARATSTLPPPPAPPKRKSGKSLQLASLLTQLLILGCLGTWLYFAWQTRKQTQAPLGDQSVGEKWTYKTLDLNPRTFSQVYPGVKLDSEDATTRIEVTDRELADLGYDGWELCATLPVYQTAAGAAPILVRETLIFKKRILSTDAKPFHPL